MKIMNLKLIKFKNKNNKYNITTFKKKIKNYYKKEKNHLNIYLS